MATARIVADGLAGFAGPATLYEIDPPISGTDHVLVYFRAPMLGQKLGQMSVVLATSGGVGYGGRMDAVQGSYVTNEPNHLLALQLAGGYVIVEPEPVVEPDPAPEPEPTAGTEGDTTVEGGA